MLWHQIKEFLIGKESSFDLEYRIFNLYSIMGIAISLLSLAICYYLNSPLIAKIIMYFFIAVVTCCWYLSRFRRLFSLSNFIGIFILIFIITPGVWISNSGSSGGLPYYSIVFGILVCSFYQGWRRYTWLVILFAVIGVLMVMECIYPQMITPYSTVFARNFDVYTSICLAMLSSTGAFIIYANNYRAEHERVKEYAERLEKIAVTDGLTDLYNHSCLHSRLEEEIYKAERYKHSLSLIMIDTDYFKNLNDTYGHLAGDLVLKQLADILRSNTRSSDIVGRYGGEEFLILCPETSLEGAVAITEKLRIMVEAAYFGKSGQIKMTISCGVTTWRGENRNKLLEEVDQALYVAKKSGRNRVEIYEDITPGCLNNTQ